VLSVWVLTLNEEATFCHSEYIFLLGSSNSGTWTEKELTRSRNCIQHYEKCSKQPVIEINSFWRWTPLVLTVIQQLLDLKETKTCMQLLKLRIGTKARKLERKRNLFSKAVRSIVLAFGNLLELSPSFVEFWHLRMINERRLVSFTGV